MGNRICVIEVNEVANKVWDKFVATHPDSTIARLLSQGKRFETTADDVDPDFLYPSQTWASINTGRPYAQHKVHWYNDPKRMGDFWFHHAACAGRTVGLVNVLHTSPLANLEADGARYKFVIPDCFAPDARTLPADFQDFQKINLDMTQRNGRAATSSLGEFVGLAVKGALNPRSFGLGGFTVAEGLRIAPTVLESRERLRSMQFPPLGQMFERLVREHDPDVAVIFTNHVAATQHRYWYALFPEDYAEKLYDDAWVERYSGEILRAMGMLDRYLTRIARLCQATGRVLVLATSMGQKANPRVSRAKVQENQFDHRLDDPLELAWRVLQTRDVRFERAMIPEYTFVFPTEAAAASAVHGLEAWLADNPAARGEVDLNGCKATLSIRLRGTPATLKVRGQDVPVADLGFVRFAVEDHHSGLHEPSGLLVVWNDQADALFSRTRFPARFSYLRYAPELRRFLGLDAAADAPLRAQEAVPA